MRDGFRIIDCDRHVMEPADMWERYLDRPFRHYVGWLVQATDTIGARINDATWRGAFSYAISCGFDSKVYLDDLDREGIDVGFIGAGCGWLPYWLERLEEHWGGFFGQDSPSTQAPDRVFKAQGFAACDPWERTLPEVVDAMGERVVVWGSQYPLPDILHFFPHAVQLIVEDRHLAAEAKRRILWDNAAELFHIGK